jgi:hypothetical protein
MLGLAILLLSIIAAAVLWLNVSYRRRLKRLTKEEREESASYRKDAGWHW